MSAKHMRIAERAMLIYLLAGVVGLWIIPAVVLLARG